MAITTTTGVRAATDPFGVITAVTTATSSRMTTSSRVRLSPARRSARSPTHAVTPVASSASLTTNNAAMKMTVGSPNPLNASVRSSTPVAHSANGTAMGDQHDWQAVPDEDDHRHA